MRANKGSAGRLLKTAFGIVCVALLFGMALAFPRLYYKHYDNKILSHASFIDINISTYEVEYESFGEKLRALLSAISSGEGVHALQVDSTGYEMSKAEFTRIVNQELKNLKEKTGLIEKVRLKKKDLSLYERYIFYGGDSKENFKGINCWKLVYKNKKRKVILYLDEEYHKIYYFENYGEAIYEDVVRDMSYSKGYGEVDGQRLPILEWWEKILNYYGFSYQDSVVSDSYPRMIVSGEDYNMILLNEVGYDEEGKQVRRLGIEIMKMIQF